MSYTRKQYQQDVKHCQALHKKHGKSYYFATKFFPRHLRYATFVLYAFFRVPDEIVDNPTTTTISLVRESTDAVPPLTKGRLGGVNSVRGNVKQQLEHWRDKWRTTYHTQESDEPVLRATAHIFHKYNIPYNYSEDFLKAMIQDTEKSRYKTYEELQDYMYGSAAVVGLMMSYVIGFTDVKALKYAESLGYAMQLTNFLRDIREDYELRDRIYLPAEDMKQFQVSEYGIHEQIVSDNFIELMKFEIERAQALYAQAEAGIPLLNKRGRFAVTMASVLYSAILDKIEEAKYDVFSSRVGTSSWEKLTLLAKHTWKNKVSRKTQSHQTP